MNNSEYGEKREVTPGYAAIQKDFSQVSFWAVLVLDDHSY
jgi:hypothetical protein